MQFIKKFTVEQPEVYRGGGGDIDFSPSAAWGSLTRDPGDFVMGTVVDPGGLFYQGTDPYTAKRQAGLDIGGIGAKPAQEAKAVEKAAGEQQAAIAKQEAEIEKKRKAQQAVIDERASRMAKNQLLTGKETGITNGSTSLLKG